MGGDNVNVQDAFLFQCRKKETPLRVVLTTGEVIEGRIVRFDRFAVVLKSADREMLVYKHAVATMEVSPAG